MKSVNKLIVTYHSRSVGTLSMTPDNRLCAFQYDREWLANGFSISPLDLPLKPDLFIAKPQPFWGNFGIFEDSLPDGYGRYLLHRLLKKQGVNDSELTPLQRLSIVGTSGMGALCYIPETYIGEEKSLPTLDCLQQMALDILSEKSYEDEEVLYFNSGNSGGCRPKCLLHDTEGAWLVKFRHTYDPKDMGAMEYRYNEVARKCGIIDTLNVAKTPLKEGAKRLFGDEDFQAAFEVAGVESSIRSLMECIEKGSTIVVVAVFGKDPSLNMFYLGEHELKVNGTMMYRHEDYLTAIDQVSSGAIRLEPLISNHFPFEQYDEAYKFIDENSATSMKIIIKL